jgi:hypothetical protein
MVKERKKFETDLEKRLEEARERLSELEKMAENPEIKDEVKTEIRELSEKEKEFRSEFRRHEEEVGNVWEMMDEVIVGMFHQFVGSVDKLVKRIHEFKE